MAVKFFCKNCGKEIWQEMKEDQKKELTISEAEETCLCTDCILAEAKEAKMLSKEVVSEFFERKLPLRF